MWRHCWQAKQQHLEPLLLKKKKPPAGRNSQSWGSPASGSFGFELRPVHDRPSLTSRRSRPYCSRQFSEQGRAIPRALPSRRAHDTLDSECDREHYSAGVARSADGQIRKLPLSGGMPVCGADAATRGIAIFDVKSEEEVPECVIADRLGP